MGRDKAITILKRHYRPETAAFKVLVAHGDAIRKKAMTLIEKNPRFDVDTDLIEESAYLHDIGIIDTSASSIGCHGDHPYLTHGVFGKARLEQEALPKHARIAERHIGVGLTKEDIVKNNLPLPHKDMMPETIEEEIICFLDLFFSKIPGKMDEEKPKALIRENLATFGNRHVAVFDTWCKKFNE